MKRLIDKIAWWIPIKKLREKFRNNFSKEKEYDNINHLQNEDTYNPYSLLENKEYDPDTIAQVEIGIFTYCNRQCHFCTNSIINRHEKNIYMDEKLYIKILKELKEFKRLGYITYSRYNEPTADRIILKRIKQAREILPNIWLTLNTNGDYLTKEYLDEFAEAGLNHMQIQCYLNKNESFDVENIIKPRMMKLINKLGLEYEETKNDHYIYELKLSYQKMHIYYQARNIINYGWNMAGLIKDIKPYNRTEPCYLPITHLYIDYNGDVVPCCIIRTEIDEHKNFIMGNLNNNSIKEIRNNKKFTKFRNEAINSPQNLFPCNSCALGVQYTRKDI
ncbi:SPASM domain-containing protein [Brachyspira intermedia]|uniref:radical SAM/SPASM domain-containing protein n=1 Tax=Brachyspira intermedia TaxID=84377 RepID=UPI003005592A